MVDLPEPFVPTSPKASPRLTSKDMSSSARNSLNFTSCLIAAMKYSLRELNCSFAMLKISDTWSTRTTVSASGAGRGGRMKSFSPATTSQSFTARDSPLGATKSTKRCQRPGEGAVNS